MKHSKGIVSWLIPPPPPISYYYKKTKSPWKQENHFFSHLKIVSIYNQRRNAKPAMSELTVRSRPRGAAVPADKQDPDLGSMGLRDYLAL